MDVSENVAVIKSSILYKYFNQPFILHYSLCKPFNRKKNCKGFMQTGVWISTMQAYDVPLVQMQYGVIHLYSNIAISDFRTANSCIKSIHI